MRFSLALAASLAVTFVAQAASLTGPRALVLMDNLADADSYKGLFKSLEARQYNVTLHDAHRDIELSKFEQRAFDHLILLCPKIKDYPKGITQKHIIEFVAEGGNLVIAGSSAMGPTIRKLAREFDVEFDDRFTTVFDHFNYDQVVGRSRHDAIVIDDFANQLTDVDAIIDPEYLEGKPLLYRGMAHKVSPTNQLLTTVLWAGPEAYSWESLNEKEPVNEDPKLTGYDVSLVSVMQARNNARIAFLGSLDFLSDSFASAKVKKVGQTVSSETANKDFVDELVKWTFQEKAVLEVVKVEHHKAGEKETPKHYRIKDEMTYTIEIAEFYDDGWHPFVADDVQLELIMLDPYVRTTLQQVKFLDVDEDEVESSVFNTTLTLPDVYGVFKFTVNYKRAGLSYINSVTTVGVHPFRHDQYPRFISQAKPYYTSAASMGVGLLVFSFVYLWGGLESSAKTTKKA